MVAPKSPPPKPSQEPSFWADAWAALKARRETWVRAYHERRRRRLARKQAALGGQLLGPDGQPISQHARTLSAKAQHSGGESHAALEPGLDALRVWFVLFLLSAVTLTAGVEFGGRFGLVIGFVISLSLNLWILFLSPKQMAEEFITWELEGRDPWGLLELTREVCERTHIPLPKVALADSDELFCLSIGVSPSRSTIVFSHALVESLSKEERRLLIAFETAKIACQWTASATVARGLCRLFDWPGLRFVPAWLIRFCLGSGRVFKIDEWVAAHGESREVWARTLWSLDAMMASKPRHSRPSDSALDSVSPLAMFRNRYDRTLPSVHSRIASLLDRYPP